MSVLALCSLKATRLVVLGDDILMSGGGREDGVGVNEAAERGCRFLPHPSFGHPHPASTPLALHSARRGEEYPAQSLK